MTTALLRPATSPESVGLSSSGLDRLSRRVRDDVTSGALKGAVFLVARHGQVARHEAFGQADKTPMQLDSVFRLAAVTRPIVVAAALAMMEENLLTLNDPVAHFLPELADVRVGPKREMVSRPMTVLDLMRHTSGFTYHMFGNSPVQQMYAEARPMEVGQTNAEMVTKLARLPLECQPGSQFEYGMSTDVLGRVMEVAGGADLAEIVERYITRPMRMDQTGFHLRPGSAGLARPRSKPQVMFDYDEANPPVWLSGGAGLLSTAMDYARFCEMLLRGGCGVLSRKTVELMLSNQLPPGIAFGASTSVMGIIGPSPEQGLGHGLGVGLRCHVGMGHVPGSVGDFFWGGALGPYFWADPVEDLVCVLMLAENDALVRQRYRSLIRNGVYAALVDEAT